MDYTKFCRMCNGPMCYMLERLACGMCGLPYVEPAPELPAIPEPAPTSAPHLVDAVAINAAVNAGSRVKPAKSPRRK